MEFITFLELMVKLFEFIFPCVFAHSFYKRHKTFNFYPEKISRKFIRINWGAAIISLLVFCLIQINFEGRINDGVYDEKFSLLMALFVVILIYETLISFYFKKRRKQ